MDSLKMQLKTSGTRFDNKQATAQIRIGKCFPW